MARIQMTAQEWDDGRPKSDFTRAEGEKEFELYTLPRRGWRILSFARPGVIEPGQIVTESFEYIDNDEETDSFSGERVVLWWHFTGDVYGLDAGKETRVRIQYPAFQVTTG